MSATDIPAVAALQEACAGQAAQWTPRDYLQYQALVAESEGTLAGFIVLRETAPGLEAEILNLAVAAGHRRQGIASALLRSARAASSATLWLEVRASNTVARAFYTSLGFRESGARPKYYTQPDEDGIVMCL